MKPHQHPPVSMVDVTHFAAYLLEHYNATTEVSINIEGHGAQYALLCITVVSRCRYPDHSPVVCGWSCGATADMVSKLPEVLLSALYEVLETIDGGCEKCRLITMPD